MKSKASIFFLIVLTSCSRPLTIDQVKYDITSIDKYESMQRCAQIEIRLDEKKFESFTCIVGNKTDEEIKTYLNEHIFYIDQYLYVDQSCGSGNEWRCNLANIYTISNNELINLGQAASLTKARISELKNSLKINSNSVFFDTYNEYENNSVTSRAEAPNILAVLENENSRLKMNKNYTWSANVNTFNSNQAFLKKLSEHDRSKISSDFGFRSNVISKIFFNLVLTNLCNKAEEFYESRVFLKYLDEDEINSINVELNKMKGEINSAGNA